MEINGGVIVRNETNVNAMGGSEIIATNIAKHVDPELLKHFQIVNSRVRNLDADKLRIFLAHDLPGDPESDFLHNGGYQVFHKLVFVSHWQMNEYIRHYSIPWSHCIVIPNAIDPIPAHTKPQTGPIRLAYWSTPHRGLNILVPVFQELSKHYDVELDVFSSFNLYGWGDRDKYFEELFEMCRQHPKINYHGTVDNSTLRDSLTRTHILAYPNTWQETSCMVLIEAMAAGLLCVHPNYGALYETAGGWTGMYQYTEDQSEHANYFYKALCLAVENVMGNQNVLPIQAEHANRRFGWPERASQWNAQLSIIHKQYGTT